jgi:hypothetical protein
MSPLPPGERVVRCLTGGEIDRVPFGVGLGWQPWGGALAGTLADVDGELDKARWMVKHGRYVPGFDHLIPPDAKWANFQYAANQLKEICYRS